MRLILVFVDISELGGHKEEEGEWFAFWPRRHREVLGCESEFTTSRGLFLTPASSRIPRTICQVHERLDVVTRWQCERLTGQMDASLGDPSGISWDVAAPFCLAKVAAALLSLSRSPTPGPLH